MKLVRIPNLPENGALALIDERAGAYFNKLRKLGLNLITVPKYDGLYAAVQSHPDMLFHDLGEGFIVHAPGIKSEVLLRLREEGISLIEGNAPLSSEYPCSIAYNAARVGRYVFHNFRYTDSVLLDEIDKCGLKKINVKQGYSKCSVCVINKNAIITADRGIHSAALEHNIESLLIQPQKSIILKGLDYGFIGGCSGKLAKNKLCVFGNAEKLEDWENIVRFAQERGVEIISLGEENAEDFGSLLVIGEK